MGCLQMTTYQKETPRKESSRDYKYMIFWRTKDEKMPESLIEKITMLATLLKIVQRDACIETWGRCEGVIFDNKYYYNGFVLYRGPDEIGEFLKQYEEYIDITSVHKYTNVDETQDFLSQLKTTTGE